MPADNPLSADTRHIRSAAAAWLARQDRGLSPSEQRDYEAWLRKDPRHREIVDRMSNAWQQLDLLAADRPADQSEPDPHLLTSSRPRSRWRGPAAWLAIAAALALIGGLSWRAMIPSGDAAQEVRYETPRGGHRNVTLADNSVAELNTDSAIVVRYERQERRIELERGEAHFTVAASDARPFRVQARDAVVEDLGTAFSVRLHAEAMEVLVTEGSVRIDPPRMTGAPSLPRVAAGQRARVPLVPGAPSGVVSLLHPDDLRRALAWREGQLEFSNAPLPEVITEFNRHNSRQIMIGDAALQDLRIDGTFRPDNVDAFVELLTREESGFGVAADRSVGETIVLRRAANPSAEPTAPHDAPAGR